MNLPSRYRGQAVSEGIGLGEVYLGDARGGTNGRRRPATEDDVRAAFAAVARDRAALARQLRERGQALEADIVEVAALIAADPALIGPAIAAVGGGAERADAVAGAGEAEADLRAALANPEPDHRDAYVPQV